MTHWTRRLYHSIFRKLDTYLSTRESRHQFKRDIRCVQFAVLADAVVFVCVSHLVDMAPLATAIVLDLFLLIMSVVAISAHSAPLILPNIIVKFIFLLLMMFIGCISIDAFNSSILRTEGVVLPPTSTNWKELVISHPSLPLWLILFTLLMTVEVRLLFGAWYRIAFTAQERESGLREAPKQPPSYSFCVNHSSGQSLTELPSYEEALRHEIPQTSRQSTDNVCVICIEQQPASKTKTFYLHREDDPPQLPRIDE